MVEDFVIALKKLVQLASRGDKVEESLAIGGGDDGSWNARSNKPFLDCINSAVCGGKEVDDLLLRKVLTVLGGFGIRPGTRAMTV